MVNRCRPAWLCAALCAGAFAGPLPVVAILSTGGTIASRHNPSKGGYEAVLSGRELVEAVPAIREIAEVQV
ncbi:MAG TPA: asparaginase domain-containing protein, partial [Gemmataceae bacterium]|nr:asparaginase domain-containing protein [Gemmataceae bacterium]